MRGCNLFLHILKRQPLTIKLSAALGNGSLSQKICSFLVQSRKKVKVMEIFTGPGKSLFSQLTHQ